ncbi:MAG TPA: hypothetical protein VF277_06245 [Steroidobacteraceae bacterium]
MTGFIIICAVMLLAAITAVAVPLLKPAPATVKGQSPLPPAVVPAVAIGLLLAIGAAGMYKHASNFPWQDPSLAKSAPAGHGTGGEGSIDEVMSQLQAKLQANPNDAEGWRMLARTYLVTNRPQDALGAYQKALAIVGDKDAGLNLDYAEAMILTEDPALQTKAGEIVGAILAADPNNQKALWYSGVMAYKANDTATAKLRWTKLLAQNPPDEIRQIIEQQLQALGGAPAATTPEPAGAAQPAAATGDEASPAASGRTIRIAVSLDPSLKDKAKPGTTVFVAAREPGIPGPPLAATRLTVDELPTTVVLSDAGAMIAGRNLSSVSDVEVVARVAFNGAPMAASGDLIGTVIQKKGGPEDVSVSISKVQP